MASASNYFQVVYSLPSTVNLTAQIQSAYDIDPIIECQLWHRGVNDTYLVRTMNDRFMLRIYRVQWRSTSDILFELDMLNHLHQKQIPVSIPLAKRDGTFLSFLAMPEGERQAALFSYAPGRDLAYPSTEAQYLNYGRTIAEIHTALDTFSSQYTRFSLDFSHLLDAPLLLIQPFLTHRREDADYLLQLASLLKKYMAEIPDDALEWGPCHGDVHGGNAHMAEDQTITFFDFDCGGPGWRAYDLAVFLWAVKTHKSDNAIWTTFLRGYTEQHPLSENARKSIPLFVAMRDIWLMGLQVGNAYIGGSLRFGDQYFNKHLTFLRQWVDEEIAPVFQV